MKTQNRNDKCNCGSGLKYKNCCGTADLPNQAIYNMYATPFGIMPASHLITPDERVNHKSLIDMMNPIIKGKNLEVMSYQVNPVTGLLEVELTNTNKNKRIVFVVLNKRIETWVYLKRADQMQADDSYTVEAKNISGSKRIEASLKSII